MKRACLGSEKVETMRRTREKRSLEKWRGDMNRQTFRLGQAANNSLFLPSTAFAHHFSTSDFHSVDTSSRLRM
jgi:hypothetical protein